VITEVVTAAVTDVIAAAPGAACPARNDRPTRSARATR
jgi:hypothetical protein